MNALSSRETNTVESKKRKFLLTETSIGNKQHNKAVLLQEPNHHNEAVLLQEPNHYNEAALLQEPNHHNEAALPQEPNHHNKAAIPQEPNHIRATPSSVLPQGLNRATPSSVWPSDLITILRRIAATPCRHPLKPLFVFEFSLEAANKNFILLKHKFGGDLLEALLAQSDSPLGYGSEFKPIETLELIFKNHLSWSRRRDPHARIKVAPSASQ